MVGKVRGYSMVGEDRGKISPGTSPSRAATFWVRKYISTARSAKTESADRPEEFCKLGLPEAATYIEEHGGKVEHQILRHVRPITGCDLAPEETNKHGLPLQDSKVESLVLQWKRNSNDTINFYAILTESAYDLLVSAGSSITVDVHLNDDEDTGEKVFIPVKVEVGRWSLMGSKSRNNQAAPSRHQHQEGSSDERTLRATSEAAILNMQKTTEECLKRVQQASTLAPPISSTTPETKSLLSHIGNELELLNQKAAAAAARTEDIEATAADRHKDITTGIRDFHSTYKGTGQAMVDTLVSLTNRLTKAPEEDRQEASSEGGTKRWAAKSADTSSKEEGSTQPKLLERLQYVATDPPEVRKAKYDQFMADREAARGETPYGGIPYRGRPQPKEGQSDRSTGLGVKKKVITKIPRKQPKPTEPPAKKARGQETPADIPMGVPASGQLNTRRTTRLSAKRSMSSESSP
ncbi:hypothetical protein CYMTET_25263 [Cymbomonas tetramitiformis]|uniref:Uncharacterized protein n=1 Tax=Cymbomonas tetramitiformis TaxID=36881 RepID=A0AAE0KZ77_9CHLO|nr:hypothetical protein CYMTET_25263 [Cymbomonas tetramitiformis]